MTMGYNESMDERNRDLKEPEMNAPLMNAVIGRNLSGSVGTWEYLVSTWDTSSQAVLSGWTTDASRATRWYPEIAKQMAAALDEFYGFRHERSMLVISRIS